MVFGAGAVGSVGRRGTAWAAGSFRAGADEFIGGQLAIPIFVQGCQDCRGVGNFAGIDDSIVVGINGADDGGRWWAVAGWGTSSGILGR